MELNNVNSSNLVEEHINQIPNSSETIEEQNKNISTLREHELRLQSKETIQAEIMSYFIQNPDENITMGMHISKDPKDGCEIVDFWNAQYEDENLNSLFNWTLWKIVWWLKIKANETWEKNEEFSKELVIDRKTDIKWMLFVWKKWFNIGQIEFNDITKYEVPYETYFAYRKNWKTYIKIIKNESINTQFKSKDWNISWKMKFWTDWLKWLTSEMIQEFQSQLIDSLKVAKINWTLDETINMLLDQMSVANEMKEFLRTELYSLSNGWN